MKISSPNLKNALYKIIMITLCVSLGWYLKGRLSPAGNSGMRGMGEVYVLAKQVENKDVTSVNSKISYVEAINEVNLLPKVTGTIEKVLFTEGSLVYEGDILFEIDPSKYQAAYDLALARLDSAKANLVKAERDYNRQVKLSREKFASKATFDTSESAYLQAKAAVQEAQANLDVAKIDLENTKVKAPINGKIGKALATTGNYVVDSQVVLAKIVQVNPIRVSFALTDKEVANLQKDDFNKENLSARITLATGDIVDEKINRIFFDNAVNTNTATISVYADVANTSGRLISGNYVQTAVMSEKPIYSTVVQQSGINYDKDGAFVYIVKIDENNSKENDIHGIAEQRRVVLGDTVNGSEQIILNGLNEGELVVVQGNVKIQNNSPIKVGIISNK